MIRFFVTWWVQFAALCFVVAIVNADIWTDFLKELPQVLLMVGVFGIVAAVMAWR